MKQKKNKNVFPKIFWNELEDGENEIKSCAERKLKYTRRKIN